jgi:hypothetical protein
MKVVCLAKIVMEFNKIKKNLQDLNLKPRYSSRETDLLKELRIVYLIRKS